MYLQDSKICYGTSECSFIHDASVIPFPGQLKKKDHSLSDSNVYHTLPTKIPESNGFCTDCPAVLCLWNTGPGVFGREARKTGWDSSVGETKGQKSGWTETGRSSVLFVSFYSSSSSARALCFLFFNSFQPHGIPIEENQKLRQQPIC